MSTTGPLLESQEAEIFEIIERDERFAPAEFNWNRPPDLSKKSGQYVASGFPSDAMDCQTLIHEPSQSRFKFKLVEKHGRRGKTEKRHSVEVSPSLESPEGSFPGLSWENVRICVGRWLDFVHREHTTENPWVRLERSQPEAFLPPNVQDLSDDQPFNPEQQEKLRERLDALEQEIRSLRDLHEQEIQTLHRELESLRDQLSDLDQKGWTDMAMFRILRIFRWLDIDPSELQQQLDRLRDVIVEYSDQIPG